MLQPAIDLLPEEAPITAPANSGHLQPHLTQRSIHERLHHSLPAYSMPPIPHPSTPRIVIYYQTLHHPDGTPCSILPIITQPNIAVTHVNLAAIHLNDPPGNITLVGTEN